MSTTPFATIADRVWSAGLAHPDATALVYGSRSLTWRELLPRAAAIARRLPPRVSPRVVAVVGAPGPTLWISALAVLRAGHTLLFVDTDLGAARLRSMVAAARPAAAVCVGEAAGLADLPVIRLPEDPADLESASDAPWPAVSADDPAYVTFTSGTTGRPQGILGRHRGLRNFVDWQRHTFDVGPSDRVVQHTAPTFDVVLRELFLPWTSGAALVLAPTDAVDAASRLAWMRRAGITVAHVVPTVLSRWVREATEPLPELRLLFSAGEPLPTTLVRRWTEEIGPRTTVVNLYGPSETTLAKLFHVVTTLPDTDIVPVGRPLPGTVVRVVDAEDQPCLPGETGQVVLSTPDASLGYLDAPAAARARFAPLPALPDQPAYRTGDLGRFDEHGDLHLLGRMDHQVKINGVRTEPDGIAACLASCPGVGSCAVVVREVRGHKRLVAYVSPPEPRVADATLREHLARHLPAAVIPTVFVRLEHLPRTRHGKLDRAALPDPFLRATRSTDGELTPAEAVLADRWERVLGIRPGRHDDFFGLGGDSIAAASLIAAVGSDGALLTLADVFASPRLDRMARALTDAPPRVALTPPEGDGGPLLPLAPQQERYRQVYLPRHNGSWCNMVAVWRLPFAPTREALAAAVGHACSLHDALRLSFPVVDGVRMQRFEDEVPEVLVSEHDLRHIEPVAREEALDALRTAEAERPIDIDRWPVFRVALVHLGEGEAAILWNIHHLAADGRSQEILHATLLATLEADRTGQPRPGPTPSLSYRDYCRWRLDQEARGAFAEQRRHWQQVFAVPYHAPLLGEHVGVTQPRRGHRYVRLLPESQLDLVQRLARDAGVSAFAVMLTALFRTLHDELERDDLVIGTPAAGRHGEVADTFGNFISLVSIRHRDTGRPGPADLRQTMAAVAAAMSHADWQYHQVMADCGVSPDEDRFPLTTLFISMVHAVSGAQPPAAARDGVLEDLGCDVKFDLMVYLRVYGEQLAVEWHARRGVLPGPVLAHLAQRLEHHVEGLGQDVAIAGAPPSRRTVGAA